MVDHRRFTVAVSCLMAMEMEIGAEEESDVFVDVSFHRPIGKSRGPSTSPLRLVPRLALLDVPITRRVLLF